MINKSIFQPDRDTWENLSQKNGLAKVIDPLDKRGGKNKYIDTLHRIVLNKHLSGGNYKVLLDFGCGSGRFTNLLSRFSKVLIGLDITEGMLRSALERDLSSKNFVLFDGIRIPLKKEIVDLVVTIWVFQYSPKNILSEILSEIRSSLKRNSKIISIEQVSNKRRGNWKSLRDYIEVFKKERFKIINVYPIRRGHSLFLYPVILGIIPESLFSALARAEIEFRRRRIFPLLWSYEDILFEIEYSGD
jgi:SAM-dependent methyltransferase